VLFGGYWGIACSSGSHCSSWYFSCSDRSYYVSARYVCKRVDQ
jgi:hypothetical protein